MYQYLLFHKPYGVLPQFTDGSPEPRPTLAGYINIPEVYPVIRFRSEIATSWIEITMTEGKNRQVRRMTAAVGFPTLRLIRVGIGELTLQGLSPGQYRHLTATETVELRVGFQRKR